VKIKVNTKSNCYRSEG